MESRWLGHAAAAADAVLLNHGHPDHLGAGVVIAQVQDAGHGRVERHVDRTSSP